MSRAAAFTLALSACILALLSGCAAPGDPSARHPIVPTAVSDLSARQAGTEVVLTFEIPTRSTDREALAEMPSVEIYRAVLAPGAIVGRNTQWRLVYAIPTERLDSYLTGNRVEFRDPLTPEDLARAAGTSLAYDVRTRVVKSRASADSNIFTVRVFPPPAAPEGVRASVTESGIDLTWSEPAAPAGASPLIYRIFRAEVDAGAETAPRDATIPKLKSPLALAGTTTTAEFHDTNFESGKTYLYAVRAVARFGTDEVESADSAPTIVTARDVFPPATPTGLELGIVPATPQAPAYVELSWAISSEPDLAGYNVYRSDREDTPGERMNGETLPSPTFRDISVMPGGHYFYRVSAVDRSGNESLKSSAVQAAIP